MCLDLSIKQSLPALRYPRQKIWKAKELLARSWKPVVLTGAGISADSGVPTFRGPDDGLWHTMNWLRYSHSQARKLDPSGVFEAHERLRALVDACEPSAGHNAITELCRRKPETRVFTQNVDGLHARSGTSAYELHGSLNRFVCEKTCDAILIAPRGRNIAFAEAICICGNWMHHDTVLFGDNVRHGRELIACLKECDLILLIGTSGLVTDARSIARYMQENSVPVVEINPAVMTPSRLFATVYLRHRAEIILPDIV